MRGWRKLEAAGAEACQSPALVAAAVAVAAAEGFKRGEDERLWSLPRLSPGYNASSTAAMAGTIVWKPRPVALLRRPNRPAWLAASRPSQSSGAGLFDRRRLFGKSEPAAVAAATARVWVVAVPGGSRARRRRPSLPPSQKRQAAGVQGLTAKKSPRKAAEVEPTLSLWLPLVRGFKRGAAVPRRRLLRVWSPKTVLGWPCLRRGKPGPTYGRKPDRRERKTRGWQ